MGLELIFTVRNLITSSDLKSLTKLENSSRSTHHFILITKRILKSGAVKRAISVWVDRNSMETVTKKVTKILNEG